MGGILRFAAVRPTGGENPARGGETLPGGERNPARGGETLPGGEKPCGSDGWDPLDAGWAGDALCFEMGPVGPGGAKLVILYLAPPGLSLPFV